MAAHSRSLPAEAPLDSACELLADVPFFDFLDAAARAQLAGALGHQDFAAGDLIFQESEPGEVMYLVSSGRVELFTNDTTGERVSLHIAEAGEIFGELSLLDGGARTSGAIALGHAQLLTLSRRDFFGFLGARPEFALRLLDVMGKRLRKANQVLRTRVARNANDEIARELTWLQKAAAAITRVGGSLPFLFLNAAIVTVWMLCNLGYFPPIPAFDPFPCFLLAILVSLESLFLSISVLCAENLQCTQDKIRSNIEYDVNVKAEREIRHLHQKIDMLHAEMARRLPAAKEGR
jgi:CRP/FNR family transcriptional regulator, cyclic AMP receptor protein